MKKENTKIDKWEERYEKFKNKYQTEENCIDRLTKNWLRDGYICPDCGHDQHYAPYKHGKREIYQCKKGKHQPSVTSAIKTFKGTRQPLMKWFKMIFLIAQRGKHISTMEILRRAGFREKQYKTVLDIRKKIEEGLNQESAFKIFKGIAREKDIDRYQRNKLVEKLKKYIEAKKKKKKK